jgi:hypothetical protein
MTWLDAACLFALLVIFTLGAIGFFWHMRQSSLDREVTRHIKLTRFHYDQHGNPAYFYDPATGEHFLPAPGNNPTAPPENIIFQPVRVEQYQRPKPPPAIYSNGQSFPIEDTSSKIEVKEVLEASDSAAIRQVTGQTGGTTYKRAKNLLAQFNKGAKDD